MRAPPYLARGRVDFARNQLHESLYGVEYDTGENKTFAVDTVP